MGSRKKCCIVSFLWAAAVLCVGGEAVKVGVVLDLNWTVGRMSKTSIQLALSDFYSANPQYKTSLSLLFKDAGDIVGVASAGNNYSSFLFTNLFTVNSTDSFFIQLENALAATELLRDGVEAIIGPQTSEQATYLTEFGRKYEIPVISFTATSPSLSPKHNPYFIRATQSDSAQVEAINAIIQMYGWLEIVPIYEDTEFGHGIIPYLADALQQIGTRLACRTVIPLSASETRISEKLKRLKDLRKRMFVVHMSAAVGSKVFIAAKKEGMMSEGYAWIVTDSLSSLLDPITDSKALDAMQGIVGVRPRIPIEELQHFQARVNKPLPLSSSSGLSANPLSSL